MGTYRFIILLGHVHCLQQFEYFELYKFRHGTSRVGNSRYIDVYVPEDELEQAVAALKAATAETFNFERATYALENDPRRRAAKTIYGPAFHADQKFEQRMGNIRHGTLPPTIDEMEERARRRPSYGY